MTSVAIPTVPIMPGAKPLIGHALRFRNEPLQFLEETRQHGPVTVVKLGPKPAWIINSTELIRQILFDEPLNYNKGLHYDRVRLMFGNGLPAADGQFHRRQRRLMQPAFHSAEIRRHVDMMALTAEEDIKNWPDGGTLLMDRELRALTLKMVGRSLFSTEIDVATIKDFEQAVSQVLAGIEKRIMAPFRVKEKLPLPANFRFQRALTNMHNIVDTIIARYRVNPPGTVNLISMLMDVVDDDGAPMTDQQVHDEVMSLLVSGFETTATALAWVTHILSTHQDVQRAVQDEVDAVVGAQLPTLDTVRELHYIQRVVAETSRLYPCIPMMTRRPIVDVNLGGHRIPAGDMILIPIHPLHRDPEFYPHPEQFDPDRWLPDNAARRPSTAYLSFSRGIRGCIGEQFAKATMSVVLSIMCKYWNLMPAPGAQPVRPLVKATLIPSPISILIKRR